MMNVKENGEEEDEEEEVEEEDGCLISNFLIYFLF